MKIIHILIMIMFINITISSNTISILEGETATIIASKIQLLSENDTLYFENDVYELDDEILFNNINDITVLGESKEVIIEFSVGYINQNRFADPNNKIKFNLFNFTDCQNINISNIQFRANSYIENVDPTFVNWRKVEGPYNSGIYIEKSTNITVSNCKFNDYLNNGIYAYTNVSNCTFELNDIGANLGTIYSSGIVFDSESCINNFALNNKIDLNGPMGIWIINGTKNNIIKDNYISNCSYEGIVAEGPGNIPSTRNKILSNYVTKCKWGIVFRCHSEGLIDNNIIIDCDKVGIQVLPELSPNNLTYRVFNNVISNNNIQNCGVLETHQAGISIGTHDFKQHCENNLVIGNSISGCNRGISVEGAKSCAIINNHIENVNYQGIYVTRGAINRDVIVDTITTHYQNQLDSSLIDIKNNQIFNYALTSLATGMHIGTISPNGEDDIYINNPNGYLRGTISDNNVACPEPNANPDKGIYAIQLINSVIKNNNTDKTIVFESTCINNITTNNNAAWTLFYNPKQLLTNFILSN